MQPFAHYALPAIVVLSGVGALFMCLLVLKYGFEPDESDSVTASRRLLLTRFGHAVAGACFGATAVLAIVLILGQRPAPRSPVTDVLAARVESLAARLDEVASRSASTDDRVGVLGTRVDEVDKRVSGVDDRIAAGERSRIGLSGRLEAAEALVRRFMARLDRAITPSARQQATVPSREPSASPKLAISQPASPPAESVARASAAGDAAPISEPSPVVTVTPPATGGVSETRPAVGRSGTPRERSSAAVGPAQESPAKERPAKESIARSTKDTSFGLGAKFQSDWDAMKRDAHTGGEQIRDGFGSVRRSLQKLFGAR
jgi:hypothetical protein